MARLSDPPPVAVLAPVLASGKVTGGLTAQHHGCLIHDRYSTILYVSIIHLHMSYFSLQILALGYGRTISHLSLPFGRDSFITEKNQPSGARSDHAD